MEKIKVLVVAPYQGLQELINNLAPELPEFDITTVLGDLSEGLHIFKQRHLNKQFDVVISRGGTAKLLRQHTSLPVVDIQVSGFDILRMLTLLKGYQSKIKMIGFPNVIQGFIAVSSLMNIEIPYSEIDREDNVGRVLQAAKEEGVIVVVGDNVTTRLANEMGLQGVLITSGKEAVMDAFNTAKQMYRVLYSSFVHNAVFKELLNEVQEGLAIITEDGQIDYANNGFHELLNWNASGFKGTSLYEEHPFFERLIHSGFDSATIYETEKKLTVFAKRLDHAQGAKLYLVKVKVFERRMNSMNLIYHKKTNHFSFPQIIMSGEAFKKAEQIAKLKLNAKLPIVMFGEKGSGKKLFVDMLYQSEYYRDGGLLEIEIQDGCQDAYDRLSKTLGSEHIASLIYIRGLEHMSLHDQRRLVHVIREVKCDILISFMRDPKVLKEEHIIDGKLYEILGKDCIYFPPIRENHQMFEELVRTFIVQYNEKYGKQVVGVRPNVLKALKSRAWEGNFIELKEMTEKLVRHTAGEYIEEETLRHSLSTQLIGERDALDTDVVRINIKRSLDEIERDIIQIVLHQENMNQSKASKRLGINRSTMWRKIKED